MVKDIFVRLYPADKIVQVEPGTSLRSLVDSVSIDLRLPCGGKGRCGKCKVVFEEGAPSPTPTELDALTDTELKQGYRLGCMSILSEDAVVHMPSNGRAARILTSGIARDIPLEPCITKKHLDLQKPSVSDLRSDVRRIFDALSIDGNHSSMNLYTLRQLNNELRQSEFNVTAVLADNIPIAFEQGDTTAECYGVALDIGTTTLAAYLLDLKTGKQLSIAAAINPQTRVGDDVISRISYCTQNADGLDRLKTSIADEFNALLKSLTQSAEVSADRIYELVVVGNTCMTHLFLGIDPSSLAQAPYVPTISQSLAVSAEELGIKINPCGRVYILPNIAGYVGADTVGVILSTGMYEDDRITLAVDIGTNGEIVLGSRKRMVTCSTAAGPAFEGAHIKHGMRAAPGAVDSAWIDENGIAFSTVGGEKPSGICGSGLLDVIMCFTKAGIIDAGGRIVDSAEIPEDFAHLRGRVQAGEHGNEFVLVPEEETSIDGPIVIVQRDVREVQLAKGAIAAGIYTLMDRLGIGIENIDRVVLAGAFGNYIRKESAIGCGMLPPVPVTKVHSIGNAAGEGAKLSLVSASARKDVDRIASTVEYVELTTDFGFQERFADALMFSSGSEM